MERPYKCDTGRNRGCYQADEGKPHWHCRCGLPMRLEVRTCDLCRMEKLNEKTGKRGSRVTVKAREPYDDLWYTVVTGKLPASLQDRPGRREHAPA